ncbi:CmpA/NrtA family ABC transporter substrate-binding protein [Roseitranquillus sediminis]|uniref:CmpA/NrtA family ABC transporter substrate-binding protein n=1 Tax=Roseitranquillus sediminis TaxID=2809051 RepID=UPI001D0CDBA4|nr:CmpA/NrtA family ABC transporter substrate-binding protein [Roseitranquillus sediminis]MBM9595828.1 ABC transporter substrate-binding protein [Roseitranquillus sediminis]
MTVPLALGYIRLVDAAPVVIARELGFAEEEGLALDLRAAPSWSTLRDLLALEQIDAAHMLGPVPVAMALGLGGLTTPLSVLSVLSVNGNVVGVSDALAERLRAVGGADFGDAAGTGAALVAAAERPLRIGVPFPFSMHAELLYYWLNAVGLPAPQGISVRTVPPPLMAEAIAGGEIDAFCVGEPWGSVAVEQGVGELILPGSAIWAFAPEKVLAVRTAWAETEDALAGRLLRAVWRAGRWLGDPAHLTIAAEILARAEYLDLAPDIVDRALTGRLILSPRGESREVPAFVAFHAGAATFPWRSQAAWIGAQLASRAGLERTESMAKASAVFRPDLYRRHLRDTGAELPGASSKVEGSLNRPTPAASESGRLFLPADVFFDRRIFDPDERE